MSSALVVGANSFAGALVPVLPVLAGAKTALASVLTAGGLIALVSVVLALLSGLSPPAYVLSSRGLAGCGPRPSCDFRQPSYCTRGARASSSCRRSLGYSA